MSLARLLPRFRDAYRSIATFATREAWSRVDIEHYQLARLNETWRHAIRHVPYYQDLAARDKLPTQFASLEEFKVSVPPLEKTLVGDRPGRFLSREAVRGHWSLTSGSTAVCTRVFWEHRAHLMSLRGRYRFLNAWGVDIFDRSTMLWGDRTESLRCSERVRSRIVRFGPGSICDVDCGWRRTAWTRPLFAATSAVWPAFSLPCSMPTAARRTCLRAKPLRPGFDASRSGSSF